MNKTIFSNLTQLNQLNCRANVVTKIFNYLQKNIFFYLALSIIIHLVIYLAGNIFSKEFHSRKFIKSKPIKITVHKPKAKPITTKKKNLQKKFIIETPMEQTEPPDIFNYLGKQNHKTDKETKITRPISTALPTNNQALLLKSTKKRLPSPLPQLEKLDKKKSLSKKHTKLFKQGDLSINEPENDSVKNLTMQDLFPTNESLLIPNNNPSSEYISEDVEEGDRISLNTRDFKYVSYFSSIKQSIQLIWRYPSSAVRRGIEGETTLEFTIAKDGSILSVNILSSSGYPVLDNEAVNTIKLCSPFNPIPDSLDKEKITITGTFVYKLSYFSIQ